MKQFVTTMQYVLQRWEEQSEQFLEALMDFCMP